jgi:hypothetical protein
LQELAGWWVVVRLGDRYPVQGRVELAVADAAEPVTFAVA